MENVVEGGNNDNDKNRKNIMNKWHKLNADTPPHTHPSNKIQFLPS